MKLKNLALLLLALCVLAPASFAKPTASFRIRADIDFDFYVGSKRLPKGEYNIESVNDSGLVRISNVKSGKSVSVLTIRGKLTNKRKNQIGFSPLRRAILPAQNLGRTERHSRTRPF